MPFTTLGRIAGGRRFLLAIAAVASLARVVWILRRLLTLSTD